MTVPSIIPILLWNTCPSHHVMAKLNMAYFSSVNYPATLLSSSLPMSPFQVICPCYLHCIITVPTRNHRGTLLGSRPVQSHLNRPVDSCVERDFYLLPATEGNIIMNGYGDMGWTWLCVAVVWYWWLHLQNRHWRMCFDTTSSRCIR